MDDLSDKGFADRSHINTADDRDMRRWSKQLRVTKDQLMRLIEKVGNSVSAVRKELEHAAQKTEAAKAESGRPA